MKKINPFPSVSIELPEDIVEDSDATVASYWRKGDSCLLQISSFLREQGPQVSAIERLSQRMAAGGEWRPYNLPREIAGCETAAASRTDDQGTSWIHIYLVWEWLAVHATVSRQGDPLECDWAWNALASIRPVLM
jgi:hypothetical protein